MIRRLDQPDRTPKPKAPIPGKSKASVAKTVPRRLIAAETAGGEVDAEPEISPLSDPRVVSTLPAELLQPDELIILLLKPSPWFIILNSMRSVVFLTLLLFGGFVLHGRGWNLGMGRNDMVLIYLVLLGGRLMWQFFEWLSHNYVMTDRRVIRVSGFLNVRVFETPLKNITHTTTHFALRERLFGLGTLGFATAGTNLIEAYWHMLGQPLAVHQVVVQTLNRYGRT